MLSESPYQYDWQAGWLADTFKANSVHGAMQSDKITINREFTEGRWGPTVTWGDLLTHGITLEFSLWWRNFLEIFGDFDLHETCFVITCWWAQIAHIYCRWYWWITLPDIHIFTIITEHVTLFYKPCPSQYCSSSALNGKKCSLWSLEPHCVLTNSQTPSGSDQPIILMDGFKPWVWFEKDRTLSEI